MLRTIFVFHFIAFLCHAISSCNYFPTQDASVGSDSDSVVNIEPLPEEIATDTIFFDPVNVINVADQPTDNGKEVSPEQLLAYAKTLIGTTYKYASIDPAEGLDCSGFITHVFNHFSIQVPRSSIDFTNYGITINTVEAVPGDLILFTGDIVNSLAKEMEPWIGTTNTGDQTVFTDDDGKSYLIYSYGKGRNKIYVSEIGVKKGKVGILDCKQVFKGESREGNCLFKYKNKYYMMASNIYGWDASFAYYLVANDIHGPYLPLDDMQIMEGCQEDYAHITQTGFFYTLKQKNKETVLYCGDRWADFAGNGLGYNQWFPLSFMNDEPYFNSISS